MFGWSERGTAKFLIIFGSWLFVIGVVDSFIQGPAALIVTFFGLMPLIGGLRILGRLKVNNAKRPSAPDNK